MLDKEKFRVLFLFPQSLVFEDIAETLIAGEREAFIFNNHVEFKDALKKVHKNTLAFINIDSGLSGTQWQTYISEIKNDPHFSGVKIGIMSFNDDPQLMKLYSEKLKLEGGYHILSRKDRSFEKDILSTVEKFDRGEKRILRIDFSNENLLTYRIREEGLNLTGPVTAITSAAMSIKLDQQMSLKKGIELHDIIINDGEIKCKLKGFVMGRSRDNNNQYIIKFNSLYHKFYKKDLTQIIHKALDKNMKELVL